MSEATREEIRAKIKKIVVENLGVPESQVTDEAQFIQDLGADSLDQVELVMSLEEEFGADIRDEDADSLNTVGDAIRYIEMRTLGQGGEDAAKETKAEK